MFHRENRRGPKEFPFWYKGMTPEGERVEGKIQAEGPKEVLEKLRGKGILVIRLKRVRRLEIGFGVEGKWDEEKLLVFCRQLATLLKGGLPLAKGLGLLAQQAGGKKEKKALENIKNRIVQGYSFYAGLSEQRQLFPEFFLQMVKTGEETGLTPEILESTSDYLERKLHLKREVSGALRYPLFVLAVASGVMAFLLFNVLPYFSGLYLDYGQELPLFTRRIITTSNLFREYFPFGLLFFLTLVLVFRFKKFSGRIKAFFDFQKTRFCLTRKVFLARFASILGLLLRAGLNLDRCVEMIVQQTGNLFLRERMEKVKREVEAGEPLSKGVEKWFGYAHFLISMLRIGEETGKLEDMATQAGLYYEGEAERWIKNKISFLEPLLILLVAGLVGIIMVGMVLPMLEMVQVW